MASKNGSPRSGKSSSSTRPRPTQPSAHVADQPRTRPVTPGERSSTTIKPRKPAPPPPTNNTLKIIVAAAVLLAAVVFISLLVLGGGNDKATPAVGDVPVAADPNAQVETFANQGQYHLNVANGETVQKILGQPYNSNPPTSGPHLPYASPWGIFNQPVQDELQVHNLEHGGVVIQYSCPQGCASTVNTLSAYAIRYPPTNFTGIILAPRPNLPDGNRIALTAWTHRLLLKSLDSAKIEQFIRAYIGKGPEQDPSFRP